MPSRPCLLRGPPGPRAATPGRQPRCACRATLGCPPRSTARSRRASCPTQTRWRSRPRRPRRARVVRRSRPPRPGPPGRPTRSAARCPRRSCRGLWRRRARTSARPRPTARSSLRRRPRRPSPPVEGGRDAVCAVLDDLLLCCVLVICC